MAIQSFGDKRTQTLFETGKMEKGTPWANVKKIIKRKLDMIDYASVLHDLRSPPGNHLEALKGDLIGYYSVRINDQWRLVFRWTDSGPENVRITDYH